MTMRLPDHPVQVDPHGSEPHHVPHGYSYPKERHHWWWYAGFVVAFVTVALIVIAFNAFDHASPPLCSRDVIQTLSSDDGEMELSLAQVSCFGGDHQRRLMIRRLDHGSGAPHTLATFSGDANVRATWSADREVVVSERGGRIETFQPIWRDVRVHFRK
ncbi:MAG: hypothetical protein ACTHLA_00215 [Asticcacaulis sp.]|uniref:hypothetical protein n=1 Tax=Asticcacaulis sp. TaxID=1872648 RepID=UPI003F7BB6DA